MRGMVPKVEHYTESATASECHIDQLPPPDLMEQETLREAIEAACQCTWNLNPQMILKILRSIMFPLFLVAAQTVPKHRLRELLLRAVRLSCPEAALTILQRFPVGAMLRHEASELCESVR
jgi:hypothetical protein